MSLIKPYSSEMEKYLKNLEDYYLELLSGFLGSTEKPNPDRIILLAAKQVSNVFPGLGKQWIIYLAEANLEMMENDVLYSALINLCRKVKEIEDGNTNTDKSKPTQQSFTFLPSHTVGHWDNNGEWVTISTPNAE